MTGKRTTAIAVVALAALVGVGCGSAMSDQELRAAGSEFFQPANAPGPNTSRGAEATAGAPASPAEATAGAPAAPAEATPSPSAGGGSAAVATPASSDATTAAAGRAAARSGRAGPTKQSGRAANAGTSGTGSAGGAAASKAPGSKGAAAGSAPVPGQPPTPGAAPVGPGGRSEIRIGSIGTAGGPIGAVMKPVLDGVKAWVADVNARGGLNGHPVRLLTADDGADPNRALAAAQRMAENDKVHFFMGEHGPTTLQAWTPYLEQRNIPIVGTSNANPVVDTSPMVFQVGVNASTGLFWSYVNPILKFTDKRKVAIFYCREAETCPFQARGIEKAASSAGMQIVYKVQYSIAQPDFTAEVIQAQSAGAEALILVADQQSIIRIARAAHRQNYSPNMVGPFPIHDQRLIDNGGKDIEGLFGGSSVAEWSTSPLLADFRTAMARYVPGGILSSYSAQNWAAGKTVEKVAAAFPAGDVTSAMVLDGLHALRGETLGGLVPPMAFRKGAGHVDTNQCVIPWQIKNGKFTALGDFLCAPGWGPVS